MTVQR